ncbi:MAG: thiol peroxidase [Chloroflexi bacterium]|nr:thiol peroxidase [Chloroflexota bacterium]
MPKKPVKRTARSTRPAAKKNTAPRRPRARKKPVERAGVIEVGNKPATVIGADVKVGQKAPEFTAQANDWSEVRALESTQGKVRIITALPSLATSVCDRETKRFNDEAATLSDDIRVLAISVDLPPAQKNWCGNANVDRVTTLSDHMALEFGEKYGCRIKERRWLRRAVFVVDRDDKIAYAAYMKTLGAEPNYEEVLAAAKAAL